MSGPEELPPAGVLPEEAIRFFRSKGFAIGFSWLDIFRTEHVRAFTVAKAMSISLLEEIREAVDDALVNGTTLAEFKRTLRPKLEARGWWGRKRMIDPADGQMKSVQLGSARRLKTIFNANLRTAYQAGKWERIERTKKAFPFLEYSTMEDSKVRPQHAAWDGTILPVDDPWWDTHYGPCDWECRCGAIQRSQMMLDRKGLAIKQPPVFEQYEWVNHRTGETGMLEKGIGKGWDYNVGREYLRGLAPSPLPESFDGPDEVGAAADLTSSQQLLIARFLKAFGIDAGPHGRGAAIWMDREGWPLSIGRGWFMAPGGKVRLPGGAAGLTIDRISAAIVTPDSIRFVWVKGSDGRQLLFRRYARTAAGLTTIVDIGGVGWRWKIGAADEIAAGYNPYQPRDPKGTHTGGRFRSTGLGSFLGSLAHGAPGEVAQIRLGDASPATIVDVQHLGLRVRSPAVWLEHSRARHTLQAHGRDAMPVTHRDLRNVRRTLDGATFRMGTHHRSEAVKRIVATKATTRTVTTMVFEVRRRGLVLHTMHKRPAGAKRKRPKREK